MGSYSSSNTEYCLSALPTGSRVAQSGTPTRWRPPPELRRRSNPRVIQCRLGAVSGVECRPGCRNMPLYAAICQPLERKSLIFLGLGFFFASQLRWRYASRAKLAREPEGRGLPATLRVAVAFAAEGCSRIPPGAPILPLQFADSTSERSEPSNPSRRAIHSEHLRTLRRRPLPDWWNFGWSRGAPEYRRAPLRYECVYRPHRPRACRRCDL